MSDTARNTLPTIRCGDCWVEKVPWAEWDMQVKRVKKKTGPGSGGMWGRWKSESWERNWHNWRKGGGGRNVFCFGKNWQHFCNRLARYVRCCDIFFFWKSIHDGVGAHSETRLPFEMHNWGSNLPVLYTLMQFQWNEESIQQIISANTL